MKNRDELFDSRGCRLPPAAWSNILIKSSEIIMEYFLHALYELHKAFVVGCR